MNVPGINDMVPVEDLAKLNEALRKSTTAGYQTTSGVVGSEAGSLSPLVPQSLENVLASATYSMDAIQLWRNIPKIQVGQTVHEYNVIKDHGMDLSPFMAEGEVPAANKSEYERKFVKIKYMAELREITDIASTINPLVGPNPTALAEETERGTLRLMQKVERELWHGDEDANALGFDGIIKQISADSKSVTDRAGEAASPKFLQELLSDVFAAPRYGAPDTIYVEPKIHGDLIKQTNDFGRFNTISQSDGSFTFGAGDLKIMGPYGPIAVKAAPFLFNSWDAPSEASGSLGTPSAAAAAADAAAGEGAVPAGDYFYKVVAVSNTKGYSAPATLNGAVTVAQGKKVEVSCTPNVAAADVDFFRVYRSDKDGAADTCKLIGQIAANGALTVKFQDTNAKVPGTSDIVMVKHSPDVMRFARLLDFIRRPLAEVKTTRPFLLMLFGAPIVSVPSKCHVIKNVGLTA
tara:strand:+ start:2911 stop:4299 length:1389 start_codon:yes stop_codon:yes gene_type:complete